MPTAADRSRPASSSGPEVRNTKQRRAVRAQLERREDFVTAQSLHRALQDEGQSVSLATTYRILQSLSESGEVDVLRNDDGEAIYRQCEVQAHHHHLLCRDCGTTVELRAPSVESWAEEIAARNGFAHLHHTIEVVGLCPQCAAAA